MNLPVPGALGNVGVGGAGGSVPSQLKSLVNALADWRSKLDGLTGDLLARLRAALTLGQDTRLLQLETPLESGTLVVERCRIYEAVPTSPCGLRLIASALRRTWPSRP